MVRSGKRRMPRMRPGVALWCLLLVLAGAVTAAVGGPLRPGGPAAAALARADLTGPLNLLLVGIDPRDDRTAPLADTIIVAHVPADRRGAYLFSLPRDLVVWIPASTKSGTAGQRSKINAAMALGSRLGGDRYSAEQGYRLLARTVRKLTGIPRFDAGAVINFGGFQDVVAALGGVRMVIDQDVVSEHRKPDGTPRDRVTECPGNDNCLRPYTGVQKVYHRSDTPVHLQAWEALDYLRQRYGLPGSDYDRQRHQRQFLTAVARQVGEPAGLLRALGAAGDSLTFVGGGQSVVAWAAELAKVDTGALTTIGLPGSALFENGRYVGEQLPAATGAFFAAVAQDRVAQYLRDHPGQVRVDG